jgi:hypothetical protein
VPVLDAGVDARCSHLRRGWYWGSQEFAQRVLQLGEAVLKKKRRSREILSCVASVTPPQTLIEDEWPVIRQFLPEWSGPERARSWRHASPAGSDQWCGAVLASAPASCGRRTLAPSVKKYCLTSKTPPKVFDLLRISYGAYSDIYRDIKPEICLDIKWMHAGKFKAKWVNAAILLVAFAYGTYKMWIVPEQATHADFGILMGGIILAGILTLLEQIRARKRRNAQRK